MSDKPNTEQMAIQGLGEPLEVTIRGDRAEDIYSGHVVVVSMDGKIMAHAGDPDIWTFIRSTAKPIQAIPSVRAGVMEKFGFDTRALALMTSSHRGSPEHIAVLEQMLKLTGIKEADLVFDEAKPADPRIRDEWARKGGLPRKLYHVCAGKHIGLLALCKLRGWPMESYTDPEHPLQQEL
ncbi:asparaginase, partial [Paenibacillus sepulcri]|nr:asparaginase [Paenibacillus sepulcri]